MSEYTKGEWEVLDGVKIYVHCTNSDEVICEIPLEYAKDFNKTEKELLANARLIAAAPKTHRAFLKYGNHLPECNLMAPIICTKKNGKLIGCTCGFDKAKAAIAKAEKE